MASPENNSSHVPDNSDKDSPGYITFGLGPGRWRRVQGISTTVMGIIATGGLAYYSDEFANEGNLRLALACGLMGATGLMATVVNFLETKRANSQSGIQPHPHRP